MSSDEDAKETTTEQGNSDGTPPPPSPPRNGMAKHRGGNDDGEDHNNNDRNNTAVVKDNAQPVNDGTAEGEHHPYMQVVDAVMNLVELLNDILQTVYNVFRSARDDLFGQNWEDFDQENATEAQRQMASRVVVVLLNLLRYFNPRRYAGGLDQWDLLEYKDYSVAVVTRLGATLDTAVSYMVARGTQMLDELALLLDRVQHNMNDPSTTIQQANSEALSEDPLWLDLQDFHRRVIAFVREVVNPALLLDNAVTHQSRPTTSDAPQGKHQPKSKGQP